MKTKKHKQIGFTLLEILIALFVFTILSMIMVGALHNVISIEAHTEKKSEDLRQLQFVFLMMSRDIEQTMNRPVWSPNGGLMPAFEGTANSFSLTHGGYALLHFSIGKSQLQRISYVLDDGKLIKWTWPVIDASSQTSPLTRELLSISNGYFEYLDQDGKFHKSWPDESAKMQGLPRAVNVHFNILNFGEVHQLFIINAEASAINHVPKTS